MRVGCRKLSLSRKEYLSSAVNVLTNSPEISDINMRDIFPLISLRIMGKYNKGAFFQVSAVFDSMLAVERVFWNRALSNHIFAVYNFWKTKLMSVIFFSKLSKVDVDFRNGVKNWENGSSFLDHCIWIGCCKFSLLQREYLSSADTVLTNSPKILRESYFALHFPQSDAKIWLKCRRGYLKGAFHPLACWLLSSVLKLGFLGIYLTKSFAVCSFRNTYGYEGDPF